jgi:hypothetical protein
MNRVVSIKYAHIRLSHSLLVQLSSSQKHEMFGFDWLI